MKNELIAVPRSPLHVDIEFLSNHIGGLAVWAEALKNSASIEKVKNIQLEFKKFSEALSNPNVLERNYAEAYSHFSEMLHLLYDLKKQLRHLHELLYSSEDSRSELFFRVKFLINRTRGIFPLSKNELLKRVRDFAEDQLKTENTPESRNAIYDQYQRIVFSLSNQTVSYFENEAFKMPGFSAQTYQAGSTLALNGTNIMTFLHLFLYAMPGFHAVALYAVKKSLCARMLEGYSEIDSVVDGTGTLYSLIHLYNSKYMTLASMGAIVVPRGWELYTALNTYGTQGIVDMFSHPSSVMSGSLSTATGVASASAAFVAAAAMFACAAKSYMEYRSATEKTTKEGLLKSLDEKLEVIDKKIKDLSEETKDDSKITELQVTKERISRQRALIEGVSQEGKKLTTQFIAMERTKAAEKWDDTQFWLYAAAATCCVGIAILCPVAALGCGIAAGILYGLSANLSRQRSNEKNKTMEMRKVVFDRLDPEIKIRGEDAQKEHLLNEAGIDPSLLSLDERERIVNNLCKEQYEKICREGHTTNQVKPSQYGVFSPQGSVSIIDPMRVVPAPEMK